MMSSPFLSQMLISHSQKPVISNNWSSAFCWLDMGKPRSKTTKTRSGKSGWAAWKLKQASAHDDKQSDKTIETTDEHQSEETVKKPDEAHCDTKKIDISKHNKACQTEPESPRWRLVSGVPRLAVIILYIECSYTLEAVINSSMKVINAGHGFDTQSNLFKRPNYLPHV